MYLLNRLVSAFWLVSVPICAASSQAAEITVFSDGPLQTAMVGVARGFQAATGHTVQMVYGTAPALNAKLQAGEQPDVLISLAAEIDEMAAHKKFAAMERSIASIKLGLAVRNGVAMPDIKTLDAFKQTLLSADAIIHNSLASGLLFARQLERIGIADQVKSKMVVIKGNTQLAELAKRTGNDVAAGQLTQLIVSKEVQFAGALPPEAQAETVYSAGAFASSKSLDAARAFVQFLASPKAAAVFAAAGAR
jgi:molybdate transport system substrate-binding protein